LVFQKSYKHPAATPALNTAATTRIRLACKGVPMKVPSMGQECDIETVVKCSLQQLPILSVHLENRIEASDLSQKRDIQREARGVYPLIIYTVTFFDLSEGQVPNQLTIWSEVHPYEFGGEPQTLIV
jgi:hypothetical protein